MHKKNTFITKQEKHIYNKAFITKHLAETGTMVHTCNLALRRLSQEDPAHSRLHKEFKDSLDYMRSC